jgi:hypothetical protein
VYRDSLAGVEFSHEEIVNPVSGLRQRVILSRPTGTAVRLPAVFFIPWLSCDPVPVPEDLRGGVETLLYRIAATPGLVLMRVEKPGVGESEGDCAQTDLEPELAGSRAAFAALRAHAWVDPMRIVAMGQSVAACRRSCKTAEIWTDVERGVRVITASASALASASVPAPLLAFDTTPRRW